jgi:hypothetical protein
MNVHAAPEQASPLPDDRAWLHQDLPECVVARISGVDIPSPEDVPFFLHGQEITAKPALVLRPSECPGLPGRWMIVDQLTKDEAEALGRGTRRVRDTTNCVECDRAGAADALVAYLRNKRTRLLANRSPATTRIGAVLLAFREHLDHGAHNLVAKTVRSYKAHILTIDEWWGDKPLKAITEWRCRDYEIWRSKQKVRGTGGPISATHIGYEISTFRVAVNWFQKDTPLGFTPRFYLPDRDTPPVEWLTRDEAARYLWACRGRVAMKIVDVRGREVGWRWKVARDEDPSLTGPEGDRIYLRPKEVIDERESEIRRVLIALFTASRGGVVADTAYRRSDDRPFPSAVEGTMNRRPHGPKKETRKRRPAVPLALRLTQYLNWWARRDLARYGFLPSHVVHRPDGEPLADDWDLRDAIFQDSGLAKKPTANVLRHTCAMWMKFEGVPAQIAADFLGCSVEVLEKSYGTWEITALFPAIDALSYSRKQKDATARAKREGLIS